MAGSKLVRKQLAIVAGADSSATHYCATPYFDFT